MIACAWNGSGGTATFTVNSNTTSYSNKGQQDSWAESKANPKVSVTKTNAQAGTARIRWRRGTTFIDATYMDVTVSGSIGTTQLNAPAKSLYVQANYSSGIYSGSAKATW